MRIGVARVRGHRPLQLLLGRRHGGSPQLAQKLNDAGIFHFWQLAAMTPEDAANVDRDLKLNGRLDREGWVLQARELVAGA